MLNSPRFSRSLALVLGALAVAGLGASFQDARTIETDGLKFQVPAAWKSITPKGTIRKAQLSVPAAEGDKEAGELVVFAFPGGAGSVQANLDRWQAQFQGSDGKAPALASKKLKSQSGAEVTRVELKGTYTEPTFGQGDPKPRTGFALLGAIVETAKTSYFLKLTGPEATLKAATPGFDKLIDSVNVK